MRALSLLVAVAIVAASCKPGERPTPPPAHAAASQVADSGAAVMIGAGDIGVCGSLSDEMTSQVVDSVLAADSAAGVQKAVFTLGDNAYPAGLDRDFVRCFGSSWGDPKKRIMKAIRPAIGNHDFQSQRGAAYYRYFGSRAGPAFKGYYSYDIGNWHAVVLNSEIVYWGSLSEQKSQEEWLKKDLSANQKLCTVAYFHRPLYSSGAHGSSPRMQSFWEILAKGGVDLVLNGHEHHYERFLPMNAAGELDSLNGMEEIIAGTGGGNLTGIRSRAARNSAAQVQGHWGVLILTLGTSAYRSALLDVSGQVWDPAGRNCH